MYVCIAAVFIVLGNLYFHHKLGVFRCVYANSEYAHKPVLYHAQRLGARKNDVPHSLSYIRSTSLRVQLDHDVDINRKISFHPP